MRTDPVPDRFGIRSLDIPLRQVRINGARPAPPRGPRLFNIPDLRLILPVEGVKVEVFGDGQALQHWQMQRGDVLVLRPNTWLSPRFHTRHRHIGVIVQADSLRVCWHRCPGDDAAAHPLVSDRELILPLPQGHAIRHLIDALVAIEDGELIAAEGPALVTSILHLVQHLMTKPATEVNRGDRTWAAVVSYVYDHYQQPIGREDVATTLGLSPSYLSRLCRQRSSSSFIDYLNGIRLQNASRMLHHIELPISEVARACGFSDAGYFIRRFRRSFGTTPAVWRHRFHGQSARPRAEA